MTLIEFRSEIKYPVYHQLAMLPPDIADKITNAKTGGGRSLNAIHASKLSQIEKHLLLVLGSEMNFCKEFINQYRFISLNDLAEKISIDQRTVSSILNGTKRKGKHIPGLIEKGYVNKYVPTTQEQMKNHWKTNYCITNKIFDEYIILLIEKEKKRLIEERKVGSDPGSEGVVIQDQRSSDPGSDKDPSYAPSYKNPSILNAAAQKTAAKKKGRAPSKMKTWEDKSEIEKMDCVLHKAIDAHRTAVERRKAKSYPFDDFPDLLQPLLKKHGVEIARDFFDSLKNEGCDVRKLAVAMKEFACPSKPVHVEPKIEQNFPEKIIKQVETNTMYMPTNRIKLEEVDIEIFPIRLKKFYDSLPFKRNRLALKKEVALMGLDNFLKMRATAIMRCTYEELFTENVCKQAFF